MTWLIVGSALAGAVVVAVLVVAVRRILRDGTAEPGLVVLWLVGTTAALGLVSWGLMLLPPVNDAVLGDLPRDLGDFERMCKDGGNGSGEPFPRAASYEPGAGPHPWVAITDGWQAYSSTGTETKEPEWGEEPAPEAVQLVACSVAVGSVPGTEITCPYSEGPLGLGPATQSIEHSQGRYTVGVYEARTGDLVDSGALRGVDEVECSQYAAAGDSEPRYTRPAWGDYAHLLTDVQATPSDSY
ncbi:hypothetical protein ACH4GE_40740 [Streptomyces tendae]|uniref:hypothetical protein n=1 Tax=Streptomyces tendae TaxID=1932 RepID=UPI0037B4C490